MRTTATRNLPARLERIRRRFARWRQTRQGYARIPEGLWGLAVPAAGQYGLYPTAQALGLDYSSLKKRVAAAAVRRGSEAPAVAAAVRRGSDRLRLRVRMPPGI